MKELLYILEALLFLSGWIAFIISRFKVKKIKPYKMHFQWFKDKDGLPYFRTSTYLSTGPTIEIKEYDQ